MTALVIKGIPPWDGRYDIPDWEFTNRELYRIKEVSGGLRASELLEALDANDTAAYVGVAAVILARHGKNADVDDLWDAKVGSITIDLGDDASPPSPRPSGDEPPSGSDTSGPDSEGTGDQRVSDPNPTGPLGSETSAVSV